ncbi:MAG: hypothetical protein H6R15_1802 [Proteobacteria bacterium]|nr:hypothetical protein [Pseudomonadota bacterium]
MAVQDENGRRKLTEEESEQLISQHAPLVKAIAKSLYKKLPASVELDDLVQDGFVGLLGAVLVATKEMADGHYLNYISQRVRGAMLDGLREIDPGSRAVRRQMRRVEQAIQQLEHQLGRSPSEGEIALALAMPLREYQLLLQKAHGYTLFSLDDFDDRAAPSAFLEWCLANQSDPSAALDRRALQQKLLIAISGLAVREAEVMHLRYLGDLPVRQIARRLELSEGRICQIHAQAIAKLRAAVIGRADSPALLAPRRRIPA